MKDLARGVRIDLIIAVSALLISTLTAAAAVYQGRIISRQLSVTVWPYINFRSVVSDTDVRFGVQNVGLGPALVRGATLLVDGRPQTSLSTAVRELGLRTAHGDAEAFSSIGAGDVIRPGDSVELVHVHSKQFAALAGTLGKRFSVSVCYCSILGQCWLVRSESGDIAPADVASCDAYPKTPISP